MCSPALFAYLSPLKCHQLLARVLLVARPAQHPEILNLQHACTMPKSIMVVIHSQLQVANLLVCNIDNLECRDTTC